LTMFYEIFAWTRLPADSLKRALAYHGSPSVANTVKKRAHSRKC
jgi:hypothetical protein